METQQSLFKYNTESIQNTFGSDPFCFYYSIEVNVFLSLNKRDEIKCIVRYVFCLNLHDQLNFHLLFFPPSSYSLI